MHIYVDFDDCLCETARYFSQLALDLFQKDVPYEKMQFFDMKKTFGLTEEQYRLFMETGHRPEALLSLEETPGASGVLNAWMEDGFRVSIITGRPGFTYDASREWLDAHGLQRVPLYCLNKYGRNTFAGAAAYTLELEEFYRMQFDVAVEDSVAAFPFFRRFPNLQVMVYDRPWNRSEQFPNQNYHRKMDWTAIQNAVKER